LYIVIFKMKILIDFLIFMNQRYIIPSSKLNTIIIRYKQNITRCMIKNFELLDLQLTKFSNIVQMYWKIFANCDSHLTLRWFCIKMRENCCKKSLFIENKNKTQLIVYVFKSFFIHLWAFHWMGCCYSYSSEMELKHVEARPLNKSL